MEFCLNANFPAFATKSNVYRKDQTVGMSRHEITTGPNGETTGSLAYDIYPQAKAALIDLIWVHPLHRGKKIGSTLTKTCLEQLGLANIQVVYLLVSNGNGRAKCLYRKLGFIELAQTGPYTIMGCLLPATKTKAELDSPGVKVLVPDNGASIQALLIDRWNKLTKLAPMQ